MQILSIVITVLYNRHSIFPSNEPNNDTDYKITNMYASNFNYYVILQLYLETTIKTRYKGLEALGAFRSHWVNFKQNFCYQLNWSLGDHPKNMVPPWDTMNKCLKFQVGIFMHSQVIMRKPNSIPCNYFDMCDEKIIRNNFTNVLMYQT